MVGSLMMVFVGAFRLYCEASYLAKGTGCGSGVRR